jgi:hypothetical protein
MEGICADAERLRLAVLDELIAGLGIEKRRARPAQTVMKFQLDSGCQPLEEGTELTGDTQAREKLTFATDAAVAISTARVSFVATYQEGLLQLLPDVEMPERLKARPSFESVRASLGTNPAIFLAIENLPSNHLSRHGFFIELSTDANTIRSALMRETWCLAGSEGEFGARGILRPGCANAGVRALRWLVDGSPSEGELTRQPFDFAPLPDGFYFGTVFVFPAVQPSRHFLCRVPMGLDAPMSKILGRDAPRVLAGPRAWLRISMPRDICNLHTGLVGISLNCVSASNVEPLNETIYFDKDGTSIPVKGETGGTKHLVAPLSISGEAGHPYLSEFEPSPDPGAGRYRIHEGRIDLTPARRGDNRADSYVNVRLWLTNGDLGNHIEPGQIHTPLRKGALSNLQVTNVVRAAGGTNGESLQEARRRFSYALLSRDRIVTRADLTAAVSALDRRILKADVSSALQRSECGLQRVQRVRVLLDRNDFLDPVEEGRVLKDDLATHLRERFLYDTESVVELEWT